MSVDSVNLNQSNSPWYLSVFVDELSINQTLKVSNSSIISAIAMDLINKINLKYDWTEFWFWCPDQKIWLLPKSSSLFQFKIESFRKLHFIRRYNLIYIQLPDLQVRQLLIDFSKTVWETNQSLCKKFGIRHHEELSLQWKLLNRFTDDRMSPRTISRQKVKSVSHQKIQSVSHQNIQQSDLTLRTSSTSKSRKFFTHFFSNTSIDHNNNSSILRTPSPMPLVSPVSFFSIFDNISSPNENDSIYFESFENSKLSNSPKKSFAEAIKNRDIVLFKNYKDRLRLRFNWMVSEENLMKQLIGIYDNVVLLLRYKYHNYYYLNEVYDEIRINQIFNQAYWSIVSGETDCSADEAYVLGGIFYQIEKSSHKSETKDQIDAARDLDEDIEMMLDKLHLELIGRCEDQVECGLLNIEGELFLIKYPKKIFTRYKKFSASLKQSGIHIFKFSKSKISSKCLFKIPIKGNEIKLSVRLTNKEIFILEIILLKKNFQNIYENKKHSKLIDKFKLKFFNLEEFLRWATALRLLSKSINFALLSNYQYEYHVVSNIIETKRPQNNLKSSKILIEDKNLYLTDLIGPRFNKSFRHKEITEKILFYAAAFEHYNRTQAKIAYIKCWLTLHNAGLSYYQVRVNRQKTFELIGIGYNRIILADIDLGSITQSYEMTNILTLDTNWELHYSLLKLPYETLRIEFQNHSECQMFHEYFGGYLFIMLRNAERPLYSSEKIFKSMTARNIN